MKVQRYKIALAALRLAFETDGLLLIKRGFSEKARFVNAQLEIAEPGMLEVEEFGLVNPNHLVLLIEVTEDESIKTLRDYDSDDIEECDIEIKRNG